VTRPQGIVDVGRKPVVPRRAVAQARLVLRPKTLAAVREGRVEKGDVETIARTAAVLAVKDTPRILPMCHPIPVTAVRVEFSHEEDSLGVRVTVEAEYRTGVEMEALTGAAVALLTVWDLVKPLEKDADGNYPDARLTDLVVVEKVKG
jgi:cyclic pyranopterin phosphate synthase